MVRQFIQHRLKTKIRGGGEPSIQKRGQYIKRFTGEVQIKSIELFGDSFSDGSSGWIGESLNAFTTTLPYSFTTHAIGGNNLADIKVIFDANSPFTSDTAVILQGSINNVAGDVGKQTDLQTMKDDMSAMADQVIAAGNKLAIVGLSPFKGHVNYDVAARQQAIDYNAWLLANYGSYYVEIYTLLGDSIDADQLADEFYKLARTDLHPNKNADKMIDEGDRKSVV